MTSWLSDNYLSDNQDYITIHKDVKDHCRLVCQNHFQDGNSNPSLTVLILDDPSSSLTF